MKYIKIAGLCVVATLSMAMLTTGTASATPVWEHCIEGTGSTKYSEENCETAEAGGKWRWSAISNTEKATYGAETLLLMDTKATGGAAGIDCVNGFTYTGTVGTGGSGRIESAKVKAPKTECSRVEGGCKAGEVEEVTGLDLPWTTKLSETAGETEDILESSGNGQPGWKIKCNTLLGSVTDECIYEAAESTHTENVLTIPLAGHITFLVLITLWNKAKKEKCSMGGSGAGESAGQFEILERGALKVS